MLKLAFVDMDGTFLNSAKKITPENLAAMDLAAQRGVQFVPCTGRNVNGIPEQMVSHPSVNYAVCCNGALVCDVHTGSVLCTEVQAVRLGQKFSAAALPLNDLDVHLKTFLSVFCLMNSGFIDN